MFILYFDGDATGNSIALKCRSESKFNPVSRVINFLFSNNLKSGCSIEHVRNVFQKKNFFYVLTIACTCAFQGERDVIFS